MVWEMYGVEDRRTGREEEQRMGFSSTAQHTQTLSELPGPVGTGISSAVACTKDRHLQCCCRDGRTGVPSSVGAGVLAQSLMVPGSAMGTSVLSTTTHSRQVLQSAVGMDGPGGGAQGQDWCFESCTVHGDDAVPGGHGPPSAQDGCYLGGMEVGAEGMVALGFVVCRHRGWYDVRWAGLMWDDLAWNGTQFM